MTDLSAGRRFLAICLVVVLGLNLGLSVIGGSSGSPATVYGRPVLVALGGLLVWQGRGWARLLLILLSMGVLLAGPIALGNGLSPLSTGGAVSWLASALCAVSLATLYAVPSVSAALAAAAPRTSPPTGA